MAEPAVFHATHWKAGSQWVRAVLQDAAPGRIVPVKEDMSHVREDPIVPGGVYTPVYMLRQPLERAVGDLDHRAVFVMRDLRDTLVSWYFSLSVSHKANEYVDDRRRALQTMPEEEGLVYLIDNGLGDMVNIQRTWLEGDYPIVRYEDLIADEHAAFARLLDACAIQLPEDRRREIVDKHSFERSGRRRGQEDVTKHHRKGVAGDWREHFTPAVTDAFKNACADALVLAGYETGHDW